MTRSRVVVLGLFAVILLTVTNLLAGSQTPSSDGLSVGDFVVMIASKVAADGSAKPMTPVRAAEILKKSGVKTTAALSAPLTEGEAAQLFQQFGITLQAQRPGDLMKKNRAETLIGVFGSTLAAASSSSAGDNDGVVLKTNGVATKTSGGVSVDTTPLDCQSLPRPPAPCVGPQSVCNPCMDCCKNQLGLTGKTCGRLCQKKNLVISADEPTP